MINYTQICESNRQLFGRMEHLLNCIKYYANNRQFTEEAEARLELNEVKLMIEIGLDHLEDCWKANGEMFMAQTSEIELMASKKITKVQSVINVFLDNPNMKVEEIAAICSVHKSTAAAIISDWYMDNKRKEVRV